MTVDIPAAKSTDTAGNNNTAATQLTRTADVTAPAAPIITTTGQPMITPQTLQEQPKREVPLISGKMAPISVQPPLMRVETGHLR